MIILVILWTCVGVFISTAMISILGLLGIVRIDKKYMNALFTALILEVYNGPHKLDSQLR